jgi:tartrate dehydrogenase/decarboxylase/D-malate dehydrogenase
MFEPIHGSAPDIAGKGIANPLASIWAVSQLLDFLGYENWGRAVVDAIEKMLEEKRCLTPDLGGSSSTMECGSAFLEMLDRKTEQ